jgi:ribonuclease HI
MSQQTIPSFFRRLSKSNIKPSINGATYYEKLSNNTFLNDNMQTSFPKEDPAVRRTLERGTSASQDNSNHILSNPMVFPQAVVIINYCMMFDGCSKGNPGPAGAGVVLYANNTEIWAKSMYVGERETNNIAEYTGLIIGLNEAVRQNIRILTVKGDSELIIKQMTGRYKVKSENMLEMYERAKELEKHFDKIDYFHVYRHLNSRADALSNEGLAKRRH